MTARILPGADYAPPAGPVPILYLDAALLVVDKPAGLLTVPGKGPELADCLLGRLTRLYPNTRLVHRLDRDTSGAMVFARSHPAQRHLGLQFENRQVGKTYVARVAGWPDEDGGRIDLPLATDWPNRPRQHVDRERGKAALTLWEVLSRDLDGTARVKLRPQTGRSHQLRVHLAAIGHPILGDPLYGDGDDRAGRLMLHAAGLSLRHPADGRPVSFDSTLPF